MNKNGWYDEYGSLRHYVNDKCHNENCPAKIWSDGDKFWFQNDERHRLDGPAAEWNDGYKNWYYQDTKIKCRTQKEFERIIKLRLLW